MEAAANYSAGQAVKPKEAPVQEHARRLHEMSDHLATLNSRVENFLSRMLGPTPENTKASADQPSPTGVLYASQFGAKRIGDGLERLRDLCNRLDEIA